MRSRVAGLDAIRFVCALIVAVSHLRLPQFGGSAGELLYAATCNGPAAVIVFFVISGFVIHYPYRDPARALDVRSFWIRRFLRIGLPALAAIGVSRLLAVGLTQLLVAILWSLICEAIYYALYPALRVMAGRIGWGWLVAIAYVLGVGLAATNPTARFYIDHGVAWTWLLGLPLFLSGCLLADRIDALPVATTSVLFGWRFAAWLGSGIAAWLCWWSPQTVGYPWTLNAFGLVVAPWIGAEITHFRTAQPWPWLERAGRGSYSLYLTHIFSSGVLALAGIRLTSDVPGRAAAVVAALALAAVFYVAIERPSVTVASRLSRAAA